MGTRPYPYGDQGDTGCLVIFITTQKKIQCKQREDTELAVALALALLDASTHTAGKKVLNCRLWKIAAVVKLQHG